MNLERCSELGARIAVDADINIVNPFVGSCFVHASTEVISPTLFFTEVNCIKRIQGIKKNLHSDNFDVIRMMCPEMSV